MYAIIYAKQHKIRTMKVQKWNFTFKKMLQKRWNLTYTSEDDLNLSKGFALILLLSQGKIMKAQGQQSSECTGIKLFEYYEVIRIKRKQVLIIILTDNKELWHFPPTGQWIIQY